MSSARGRRVVVLSGLVFGLLAGACGKPVVVDETGPIGDPVPEDPVQSRLGLVLEEFAQLPATEATPVATDPRLIRHARINAIGEVPDESGRLFVPDLNGPLYLLRDGVPQVYLDFRDEFADFFSGRGLGSGFGFVAFHPEFADNGIFYTVHTETGAALAKETTYPAQEDTYLHSVINEWTAEDPAADTFSGARRELFRFGFGSRIHAIQQIDFNPTARPGDEDYGLLYLAVGDGGLGVTTGIPQDMATPAGKILRVDPRGTNGPNGEYGVPDANPFVGESGALGEIYAVGMRDPHRFTWDREGEHRMFLGHIGQHAIEAVYEVQAGDNLGWSEREGEFVFDPEDQCFLYPVPADDEKYGYVYPVAAYDHDPPPGWPCDSDSGHAISGGQVYRGDIAALQGKYVFGDLVDGRVFFTEVDEMQRGGERAELHELQLYDTNGRRMRMTDFVADPRVDLRFGTDAQKDLYLLAKANGKVWRVVDVREDEPQQEIHPGIADDVVAYYDFEHPFAVNGGIELDQGPSETLLKLVNGGWGMRVDDGAYEGSNNAIQLQQVDTDADGNDDWKAGVWDGEGVDTLSALSGVEGMSVMGWFKMTGPNPAPNTTTVEPDDLYGAVGLVGVLSGSSDGHTVRGLLEVSQVDDTLRLIALGRRLDDGGSLTFAADQDWQELLPDGQWVHLAATFDYSAGKMALYRNGVALPGFYTSDEDPWRVDGSGASPSNPRGIKIGGSFPQDNLERNPCNCRTDALLFVSRALSDDEVAQQYAMYER